MNTYQFPIPDSKVEVKVLIDGNRLTFEYLLHGRKAHVPTLESAILLTHSSKSPVERLEIMKDLNLEFFLWAQDPEGYALEKGVEAFEEVTGE